MLGIGESRIKCRSDCLWSSRFINSVEPGVCVRRLSRVPASVMGLTRLAPAGNLQQGAGGSGEVAPPGRAPLELCLCPAKHQGTWVRCAASHSSRVSLPRRQGSPFSAFWVQEG